MCETLCTLSQGFDRRGGVAAYLIRGGRFFEEGQVMLSMALWLLSVLVPLQILIGDAHGLNTLAYQPAKLAATSLFP